MEGEVKFFKEDRGFGFIKRDDNESDVFVHFRSITGMRDGFKTLREGQRVEFTVITGSDGRFQAEDVKIIQ